MCLGAAAACAHTETSLRSETPAERPQPLEPAPSRSKAGDSHDGERAHQGTVAKSTTTDAQVDGGTQSDSSSSQGPYRLALPRDERFLAQPLPPVVSTDYKDWRQLSRIYVGKSHLHFVSFLDVESKLLVHSQMEDAIRIYDRASGRLLHRHELAEPPLGLVSWQAQPAVDGQSGQAGTGSFAVAGVTGIRLMNTESPHAVKHLTDLPSGQMKWSPDRSVLVVLLRDPHRSTLSFYQRTSPVNLEPLGQLALEESIADWDLSQDNRILAVAPHSSERLWVFDLEKGHLLFEVPTQDFVSSVDLSPDGRFVAIGGQGLLVVELVAPERRAYYSYFYNNLNTVHFSPSSDAIFASSYDGHIRIFRLGEDGKLALLNVLRHQGTANVYRIEPSSDGTRLVSSSGDQTVRIFGAPQLAREGTASPGRFHTLKQWRQRLGSEGLRMAPAEPPSMKGGHYHPEQLDEAPRPCRLPSGTYACRITDLYRLRDCTVTRNGSGHTMLEFHDGNLLSLRGVLYDDGPVVRYEAWLTQPSTIVGCAGCERQAIHGVFRGGAQKLSGLLMFRNYYDPRVPPPLPRATVKLEEADDRFPATLLFRSPLPDASPPSRPDLPSLHPGGEPIPIP